MSLLLSALPPKERARVLRAWRASPEQRDTRERRLAEKVDELEAVVAALRDILGEDDEESSGGHADGALSDA